jgi:hypothetical protein
LLLFLDAAAIAVEGTVDFVVDVDDVFTLEFFFSSIALSDAKVDGIIDLGIC